MTKISNIKFYFIELILVNFRSIQQEIMSHTMTTKFSWIRPLGVYLHWPSALENIPAMPEVL
jgi:hypothetical protein